MNMLGDYLHQTIAQLYDTKDTLSKRYDAIQDIVYALPIDHPARAALDEALRAVNGLLADVNDAIWYYHRKHTPKAKTPLDKPEWEAAASKRMADIEARLYAPERERDAVDDLLDAWRGDDNG